MALSSVARRKKRSRADWAAAALRAIAKGGVDAVAVEPLCRVLGVSKGSFYWHFSSRKELIDAALDLWVERAVEDVMAAADTAPPELRLQTLFLTVTSDLPLLRLDAAIAASAHHPLVGPLFRRVSKRRVAWVASAFELMGLPASEAIHAARLAYVAYLGMIQVYRDHPGLYASAADGHATLAYALTALLPIVPPQTRLTGAPASA